ncbi:hypothetical protein HDU93_008734 [Gonapodya sp. JEL0774]|nr:hypothetical protein HDU93_008734 [Gonapodya sp. JEL0774]
MLEIRALDPIRAFRNDTSSSLPRFLVTSVAVHRFRIVERGAMTDGYHTALVERVEDIDESDEVEVKGGGLTPTPSADEFAGCLADGPKDNEAAAFDVSENMSVSGIEVMGLDVLSDPNRGASLDPIHTAYNTTRRLVQLHMAQLPPLERRQIYAMHGPFPPAEDIAAFSFWLTGILPVSEWSKYKILQVNVERVLSFANINLFEFGILVEKDYIPSRTNENCIYLGEN